MSRYFDASEEGGYWCKNCESFYSPEMWGRRCPRCVNYTGTPPKKGPQYGPKDQDQYFHSIEYRPLPPAEPHPGAGYKISPGSVVHVACQENMPINNTQLRHVTDPPGKTFLQEIDKVDCPYCLEVMAYNGS